MVNRAVVLFGAGASFGSGDVDPRPPPLGKNLFAELEQSDPEIALIPERLKALFRDNFETGMAAYFAENRGDTMAFQRALAKYFVRFRPGAENAYGRVVRQLAGHAVTYSSLNYDLLFEVASERFGPSTITDNAGVPASACLKLHGSCNFWPDAPNFKIEGLKITGSLVADIQGPVRPLTQDETVIRCREDHSLAPALALFAEGKAVRVCPDFVRRQLKEWQRAVSSAAIVCIVGVRVYPKDEHIWKPLALTAARVCYFGLGIDGDEFRRWKSAVNQSSAVYIESDFMNAIPRMAEELGRVS